jgi:hypothetical protein
MSTAPHLRLINTETGELHTDTTDCPQCADARAEAETWEQEVLKLKREVKRVLADKARERREYMNRAVIIDVFDEWRQATGHEGSKLTNDRFDGIRRMLEAEYTRENFTEMIAGLAAFPFQRYSARFAEKVPNSERRDDVAFACKTGERFEKLAVLGRQARKAAA